MNIYESAEDYLEQILMLLEKKGYAHSIDIAVGLNVSKPSVSVAMKKLRKSGYINMGSDNLIPLTDKGYTIARKIHDCHQALTKYLVQPGGRKRLRGKTPAGSNMTFPRNPSSRSAVRSGKESFRRKT